jgi:ribonuclease HI
MQKSKKYYAVARGFQPGIYTSWPGPGGAEGQIRGFAGALFKGFASLAEAQHWLENPISSRAESVKLKALNAPSPGSAPPKRITIYTDGGCQGNPGPGGYGVIIIDGEKRMELARGFRLTTNNRMELMACIAALEALKTGDEAILHSDSRYVVNSINKGWARKWHANHWMRTKSEAAENSDLWARLLELCDRCRVAFAWVHGHTGQPENERCDELAKTAAEGPDLQDDQAYTQGRTRVQDQLLHWRTECQP